MIKVKGSFILGNTVLFGAVDKIAKAPVSFMTGKQIIGLAQTLNESTQKLDGYRMELLKKHCNKNEDGTEKLVEKDGGKHYDMEGKIEEFNKDFSEVLETEVELNCNKIDYTSLQHARLSAQEWQLMEPFMTNIALV